ncbi:MAG: phosphotransferase [Zoogloeaceae bacterium]|nr:phosphotransferase [Zoogloeaceae bacterium]
MERLAQLQTWLNTRHPDRPFDIQPASADASFRRYFRVTFADDPTPVIAMDAPPSHEDCRPYLHVAELFRSAGAHVPAILDQDLDQGFLLLSDLGSTTYLTALTPDNAHELYAEALGSLIAIQKASRPGVLPDYDRALLTRELELFPVWYLGRHVGVKLDPDQANRLYAVFEQILAVNLAEPKVFVHRDYHSRNLMVSHPNPGVLDFQDAVYGPLTYDLASLFKDAYVRWDEEFILDLLARYWETARKLGLPVASFAEFHRDYEWMGVQRHLKVLGIFARLYHRDGKEGYLKDMPLVMAYLRKACERYRELGPLLALLDSVEGREEDIGYTF